MLSVSSSEDEGGPGSSGRPLGGGGVSNSILEVLRDGRGGVESSKEGVASTGVAAGGEEASESGSSVAEVVRIRENGSGISIGRAIGVGASCILSSLPGKMKLERLFRDRNLGGNKPRRDVASMLSDSEASSGSGK